MRNMNQETIAVPPRGITAPVSVAERINALDTTRGFAVLGILLMNIWSFAGPHEISEYPVIAMDWGGAPPQSIALTGYSDISCGPANDQMFISRMPSTAKPRVVSSA